MKNPDLSIIVLSFNTQDLLKNCLESLKKGSERLTTEVIVVDNASKDKSVEVALKIAKKTKSPEFEIKVIKNKENLGFAKGNNIGLKHAKGKYILFLNSDTQVFPKALKKAVSILEKNSKIGALTAKTLLPNQKMDPDCHRGFPTPWASLSYFLGLEKLFPKSKLFGQYHKFYLDLNKDHEIDAGAGAFMLVPKKVLEKVGSWDESYFFYGEDLDLYYRIKQAGYKVFFFATPLLIHYKGASSGLRKESKKIARNPKENRIKVAKASIQAMEIFYKKFYSHIYPKWLTSLVLIAIKIKGFFRVLKNYFF